MLALQLRSEYRRVRARPDEPHVRASGCCSATGAATITSCWRSPRRSACRSRPGRSPINVAGRRCAEAAADAAGHLLTSEQPPASAAALARPGDRHRPAKRAGRALDQASRAAAGRRSSASAIRGSTRGCSTWSSPRRNIRCRAGDNVVAPAVGDEPLLAPRRSRRTRKRMAGRRCRGRTCSLALGGADQILGSCQADALASAVQRLPQGTASGGSLIVVTSPRTPPAATDAVARSGAGCEIVADGAASAIPVLLADADEILSPADSVSMISEAMLTGKPVGLIPVELDDEGRRKLGTETAGPSSKPRPAPLLGRSASERAGRHRRSSRSPARSKTRSRPPSRRCKAC